MTDIPAGLAAQVEVAPDGCWLWLGRIHRGYGYLGSNRAHRTVYEILVAPLTIDDTIDHLCHNAEASCVGGITCRHRRCVNPAHLEPVPRSVNIRRSLRNYHGGRTRRTHCLRGHEFTEASTYLYEYKGRITRRCRPCITARYQERKAALGAAVSS